MMGLGITATRRIQFCAGHRVYGHESKCASLHGHNYVALVEAQAEGLDDIGRVIDFGVLKEKVGGWIETHWDHGMLLWANDPLSWLYLESDAPPLDGHKYFLLSRNPTAENMADHLLRVVCPEVLAGTGVVVGCVVLWETENCMARVTL